MIILHGYYGERNAGDDAFTTICVRQLAERGHGPIGVLSPRLPAVKELSATPLLFERRWRGAAGVLEQFRINWWHSRGARLIIGGGSLFRTTSGITEMLHLLRNAQERGHAAIGVSIGPFHNDAAARLCGEVLRRLDFIGVRDQPSLERARELAPDANVELTFDLAPLLPSDSSLEGATTRSNTLGVALAASHTSESQLQRLAAMLRAELERDSDLNLLMLPFNSHPRKGDVEVHHRLALMIGHEERVQVTLYNGDPTAMWQRIGSLRGLLAMRLHAAVFGFGNATPTVLLPYEEKCLAWAGMCGHPDSMIAPIDQLTEAHLSLALSADPPLPEVSLAEARQRALRNFEALTQ